jgi:NAD(P)H-hydrate epimerase
VTLVKIVSPQDMLEIERLATDRYGLTVMALMEQAGTSLANWARRFLPTDEPGRVVILAGGGKNGGDGMVCARQLAALGNDVTVLCLAGKKLALETQKNLSRLNPAKVRVHRAHARFPESWVEKFLTADLVIDALLGLGISGAPREPLAKAINALNASGVKVLSADVPSGLDADTGTPYHPTVRADLTLTFGLPKRGLLQPQAADFVGRLEVDSIGYPPSLLSGRGDAFAYLDAHETAGLLPRRPMNAHKRSAGRVLIVGGSRQYHGAPILAAAGAVRAGAGYVMVAYPGKLDGIMRHHLLEEIGLPLPSTQEGALGSAALSELLLAAENMDAVVLGPGLGRTAETQQLVRDFVKRVTGPRVLVADADALPALIGIRIGNGSVRRPVVILTPHEGEAAALLGTTPDEVARGRWSAAQELARRHAAVVLLKGRHTVVVAPQGPLLVVGAGSPALATAGTGDVLSGAIAAFTAQKVVPRDAAALAAYLHGVAGELASPDPGGLGVRARDVADNLPLAIRQLRLRCRRPGGLF